MHSLTMHARGDAPIQTPPPSSKRMSLAGPSVLLRAAPLLNKVARVRGEPMYVKLMQKYSYKSSFRFVFLFEWFGVQ